jgi:hypothetical protein
MKMTYIDFRCVSKSKVIKILCKSSVESSFYNRFANTNANCKVVAGVQGRVGEDDECSNDYQ